MNDIKTFSNEEFGSVRTISIDGEPWFVGKDVAEVLGYAKPLNAIAKHVDEDDSLKRGLMDSMGRMQETIVINESGLYSLILSSKLPSAKKFKHWVTSEVLPAIHKTGVYANDKTAYGKKSTSAGEVASLIKTLRSVMKDQKSDPQKIAVMAKTICEQFGIELAENFVERNPFEDQLFLLGFKIP